MRMALRQLSMEELFKRLVDAGADATAEEAQKPKGKCAVIIVNDFNVTITHFDR